MDDPSKGTMNPVYPGVTNLIRLIREDLFVHGGDLRMPSFLAIAVHRFGHWASSQRQGAVRDALLFFYRIMYRYVRKHYGIEIPITTLIGRRLWLKYPSGTVFHGKAEIGDDCLIWQNTTIGAFYGLEKHFHEGPKLGDRVEVGAGAVIFAGVRVGEGTSIGPQAVVSSNVSARTEVFAKASPLYGKESSCRDCDTCPNTPTMG